MSHLRVEFGRDRDYCGRLVLVSAKGKSLCGPFPVAGRSGNALAAANKNLNRDPLFRYGDTPLGIYAVRQVLRSGRRTHFAATDFGPHGVILIEGVSGDAALAEANGRFHFLISGGTSFRNRQLCATSGGLRMSNEDILILLNALKWEVCRTCEISKRDNLRIRELVFPEAPLELRDPVPLHFNESRSPRTYAGDGIRGGAIGAIMFGMTVSFVTMQGPSSQASSPNASTSGQSVHDFSGADPVAVPTPRYTRLAYGTGESTSGSGPSSGGGTLQPFPPGAPKQDVGPVSNPPPAGPGNTKAIDQLRGEANTPVQGGTQPGIDTTNTAKPAPLPIVTAPQAAPAEPPLTSEQQKKLDEDKQYQNYESKYENAQKDAAEAQAKQQQIQTQINSETDNAKRGQLQVDLVKARQDESNANSAAAAAKINAQERKKVVVQGAPIIQEKKK